jgi:cardiolipin synthase
MSHDEEVVLAVLDRTITAQLDAQFDDDLQRSEKITTRRWRDRALSQRVAEKATTVIHRWL